MKPEDVKLPPPDIHTNGVPRGHGAVVGYSPEYVATIVAEAVNNVLAASTQPQPSKVCKHCDGKGHTKKAGYLIPCICQLSSDELIHSLSRVMIAQPKPANQQKD